MTPDMLRLTLVGLVAAPAIHARSRELLHLPIRLRGRRVHVGVLEHCQDEREDTVAVQQVDLEEALGVPEPQHDELICCVEHERAGALLIVPDAPEDVVECWMTGISRQHPSRMCQ